MKDSGDIECGYVFDYVWLYVCLIIEKPEPTCGHCRYKRPTN